MSRVPTNDKFSDELSLSSLVGRVQRAKSSLTKSEREASKDPPVGDTTQNEEFVTSPGTEASKWPAKASPGRPPRPPNSPAANKSSMNAASKEDSSSVGSFTAAYFPDVSKRDTREVNYDPENPPPTDMAIIGIPDDVSTIANDTITGSVGGSIGSRFNFFKKKTVTPDRQKGESKDDGAESPPGSNGTVRELPPPGGSGWGTKKCAYACVLGMFLLCSIAALSYGLVRVRNRTSVSSANVNGDWDWTFKPTAQGSADPSKPTMAPSTSWSPTVPGETRAPTRNPTMAPSTSPPTQSSDSPTMTRRENLKAVLGDVSLSIVEAIETDGTAQQEAFEWLANDPEYSTYSAQKVVQRWVLVLFSLEIVSTRRRLSDRRLNEAMVTWMEYTDECTWFTSWYENRPACDGEGTFKFLVLRNIGLDGSIPSELTLLTKLDTLILSNNDLTGTIPTLMGSWTALENFEIYSNQIVGTIPTSIADMKNLAFLDLGNNRLTGTIPDTLVNLGNLQLIKLNDNKLGGEIPNGFENLVNLANLDLSNTGLTGNIPNMDRLNLLVEVKLSGTNLSGAMPSAVCFFGLDILEADCEEVSCPCCTCCKNCISREDLPAVTPDPTPDPTPSAPALTLVTPGPTPDPTPSAPAPTLVTPGPALNPTPSTPAPTLVTPGPTPNPPPTPSPATTDFTVGTADPTPVPIPNPTPFPIPGPTLNPTAGSTPGPTPNSTLNPTPPLTVAVVPLTASPTPDPKPDLTPNPT